MSDDRAASLRRVFAAAPRTTLGQGAVIFGGAARTVGPIIIATLDAMLPAAPPRRMEIPGGHRMSVAMSNCGRLGWVTDRGGYRYSEHDPDSGHLWPPIPDIFADLAAMAAAAAGYPGFQPDCCLINRYAPGARLGLHRDADEQDFTAPIVSVSLGLPARFLWGGLRRADPRRRVTLTHGDVLVFGGLSRLVFHGIDPVAEGEHPATGRLRINLTFRKAA